MDSDEVLARRARLAGLDRCFEARSVAVVGASDTATKIGGTPVDLMRRFGFAGRIHPVNPRGGLIQGLPAHRSLQAIGEPVDLAILAVPEQLVEEAIDDAIAAGVGAAVMFTSGYAEVGEAGRRAQAALTARVRAGGLRMLGPNCLGFMNAARGVYATFTPLPRTGLLAPGPIGLVSQSGAFGAYAYALARERGVGFSKWITTGNEADIDAADCLEWLAHDPDTRVIMLYLEGARDGPKLRRALAAAHAARKPVVTVKVGRTTLGATAAVSHTAALAGDDAVYDAVLREYGVYRARTIAEFFDVAASASIVGLPRDRSIGLFTISGGVGVLMADLAHDARLDVTPLPQPAQDLVRSWVPFAGTVNPLDITAQVTNDPALIERAARLMLEQGGYASWIGFMVASGLSPNMWPVYEALIAGLRRDHPDVVLALSTLLSRENRQRIESMGCLVCAEPADAVRAIGALADFAEAFDRPVPQGLPPAAPARPIAAGAASEPQGLAWLAEAGVPAVPHRVARSADEAVAAARAFGGPVALKVVSADVTHKSDVGGVRLGLLGDDAVGAAYDAIHASVRRHAPAARIDGVLVAPMVRGGVECILGARRDPVFGPMVMFGLGGVFVEVVGDVALRSAPVTREQALQMIGTTRAATLLAGARGQPPADLEALAAAIVALSRAAAEAGDTLESIDVNPFLALPAADGGGMALDAVVVGRVSDG
jgi:acyl-CoA synthetase (NDP forming)